MEIKYSYRPERNNPAYTCKYVILRYEVLFLHYNTFTLRYGLSRSGYSLTFIQEAITYKYGNIYLRFTDSITHTILYFYHFFL